MWHNRKSHANPFLIDFKLDFKWKLAFADFGWV